MQEINNDLSFLEKLKIRVFWLDDEPDTVISLVDDLEKEGLEVELFAESDIALSDISQAMYNGNGKMYHVGIADLLLRDEVGENGSRFTRKVISLYKNNKDVPARVGYVTEHEDEVPRDELLNTPFVFRYDKADIRNHMFQGFARDLKRNAIKFQADLSALEYNNKYEPRKPDLKDIEQVDTLFAYIHKIEGRYVWVRMWDPTKLMSEATRIYSREFLEERGIHSVGQALRICTFKDRKTKDIVQTCEPIGSAEPIGWLPLRSGFDYDRFRKEK